MSSGAKCDFKQLVKFCDKIDKAAQETDKFCEDCAKELAARLLAKVVKRTPVGDYHRYWTDKDGTRLVDKQDKQIILRKSDKKGGTLRRGWTTQAHGSGAEGLKTNGVGGYVDSLVVNHFGDTYVIEIMNSVEYAAYVEYGHRTPSHKGWVPGQFMLTISERELQTAAPKIVEKKIALFLKGVFDAE